MSVRVSWENNVLGPETTNWVCPRVDSTGGGAPADGDAAVSSSLTCGTLVATAWTELERIFVVSLKFASNT